jgi:hypothetical protein
MDVLIIIDLLVIGTGAPGSMETSVVGTLIVEYTVLAGTKTVVRTSWVNVLVLPPTKMVEKISEVSTTVCGGWTIV